MSREICLNWNNHASVLEEFKSFFATEKLVDVTLACEGKFIKAHKVILSACSPYFQAIFNENNAKHPIVIIPDMKYTQVKAVIDFMYNGEVNVNENYLAPLIRTAEALKVKVLGDVMIGGEDNEAQSGIESEPQSAAVSRIQSDDESEAPSRPLSVMQTDDEAESRSRAASVIPTDDESEARAVSRMQTDDERETASVDQPSPVKVAPPKRKRGRPRKRSRGYQSDGAISEPEFESLVPAIKRLSGELEAQALGVAIGSKVSEQSPSVKTPPKPLIKPVEESVEKTKPVEEPMVIQIDDDDEEEVSKYTFSSYLYC